MNVPHGKPRGAAASPEVVELYRLLHEADRPLSLAEVVARFPGSGYRSHAYRQYRAHLEAETVPVKPDNWTQAEKDKAWSWWLAQLLRTCCNTKRVKVAAADGTRASGKHQDRLVYSANLSNPPVVRVKELVEVSHYWTPEIGRTGARHAAGMQYLKDAPALLEQPKLGEEVKAVLRQGIVAIRNE